MLALREIEGKLAELSLKSTIHEADIDEIIASRLDLLLPQRSTSTNEFAATKRLMVNPGGEPFPFDPSLTPYALGISDACDHIDVREIYVKGNTRSGKTVAAENMLLRNWTYGPLKSALWLMQDKDAVNDYIDERGEEMLRIHSEVAERIDWDDSRNKSRTRKRIGRSLALWRAATHAALRAKAMPIIIADEIDAYNKKVRDALGTLITSRQEEFGTSAKAYLCSHPDAGPNGGIDLLLRDSLLHLWFAPCPDCGHAASPAAEAEDAGKPRWKWNVPKLMGLAEGMERPDFLDMVADRVRIICPNMECGAQFNAEERIELMRGGTWLQPHQDMTPDGEILGESRVAAKMGFVIHAFMAPFVKLRETARDFAAATLSYQLTQLDVHLREVMVKKLGETMRGDKPGEKVEGWQVIQARLSSNYSLKTVPKGVEFLTAFVDVQGDRFEVVVTGWNRARQSWLIDRYAIKQWPAFGKHGAFTNIDPENRVGDWAVLEDAVINQSYPLANNAERKEAGLPELFMPIAKTVVNNAGRDNVTLNGRLWMHAIQSRAENPIETWRVMLMQGSARKDGETYGKAKPVEFDDKGRSLAVFERYPNVSAVKDILFERMRIDDPSAPGRMNLPANLERRYWVELVSERKINGDWTKLYKYNETLDGYVAGEVARETLKPDRPGLWGNGPPFWAKPKPRGQASGDVISPVDSLFDRLAAINQE